MLTTKKCAFYILVIALALLSPQIIYSQWVSDSTTNVVVCKSTGNQQQPKACSDGNDGVIIVWQDYRSLQRYDIYAQRIDKDGKRVWQENGILLSNGVNKAINPIICEDGNGGAYVVWEDSRTTANGIDLYGQHISANGTKQYANLGSAICASNGDQVKAVICPSGNGNAFVAWEDSRTSIASNSRPDIYMNYLTPSGVSWGNAGSSKITTSLKQSDPCLIDDGNNGCFLAWETSAGGPPTAIAATRVSSAGNVLWGATKQGVVIHRGGNSVMHSRFPKVSRDGSEFVLAWEETQFNETHGLDILCNRIKSDGTNKWFSAISLTPSTPGDQINAVPYTDNAGGVLVAYTHYFGDQNIAVTRGLSDGSTLVPQPNSAYAICNLGGEQYKPVAVKTNNGMFVAWNDERSGASNSKIYANRVDTIPQRLLFPSGSSNASRWGLPVSVGSGAKDQVAIAPRTNGAIIVWRDTRNASTSAQDIYCQLVFFNGTLPVELADFSVKALSEGTIRLDWKTAMEKDNAGFEIERRSISDPNSTNTFTTIASYNQFSSLRGLAHSNHERHYSFIDVPKTTGTFEYRLVDVSLDGERTPHQIKQIELKNTHESTAWNVEQNFPNPFGEATNIYFEMPEHAFVEIQIVDALGRNYSLPAAQLLTKGAHTMTVRSSDLNGPSGAYYYTLIARSAETGDVIWKMPKAKIMMKLSK